MKITEIKKIGRGDRYYLILDEYRKYTIEADILAKHKLKTNDEIDEDFLNKILLENGEFSAFDRALTYLEKNIKTEKGIKEYLKQKGFLHESIENAVEKLKEYNYIDDSVYAENFIRTYASKKGRKLLAFELSMKGVDKQIIQEKLEELLEFEEEQNACNELLKKYLKNKIIDQKTKQKAYAHLIGKGFSSENINKAFLEVLCEQE